MVTKKTAIHRAEDQVAPGAPTGFGSAAAGHQPARSVPITVVPSRKRKAFSAEGRYAARPRPPSENEPATSSAKVSIARCPEQLLPADGVGPVNGYVSQGRYCRIRSNQPAPPLPGGDRLIRPPPRDARGGGCWDAWSSWHSPRDTVWARCGLSSAPAASGSSVMQVLHRGKDIDAQITAHHIRRR